MRVLGFIIGEDGAVIELENTLKEEQRFVGGHIERLSFTEGLDLICNEEGKLFGLSPTIAWVEEGNVLEIIMGNCFVCRHTEEGDFTSIKESDMQ